MIDGVGSDSARIRLAALRWAGVAPTEDELRVHLAVSPCNYWPFGSHPYFAERGPAGARDARRWFARLRGAVARRGGIDAAALHSYLAEISVQIAACLERGRTASASAALTRSLSGRRGAGAIGQA